MNTDASLLFNWEAPRRRNLAIAGFICGSAVLHFLCFYIFQIVYPPAIAILPPPARLNLIASNTEEGRTLLRWIEAEDPALASATQRPPEGRARALPKVEHIPSYLSEEPRLKEPPPLVADLRPPSAMPAGPVPMRERLTAPAVTPLPTTVLFSKELTDFGVAEFPTTKFSASTSEQPANARFRIAVSGIGDVRFCFLLGSSGDSALDQQARAHLALTRFSPGPTDDRTSLIWGTATLNWGNDIARPPARATTAPPP